MKKKKFFTYEQYSAHTDELVLLPSVAFVAKQGKKELVVWFACFKFACSITLNFKFK